MERVYDIDHESRALMAANYVLLATACPVVAEAIWAGGLRVCKTRGEEHGEQALAYLARGPGVDSLSGCLGEVVGAYRSLACKHPTGDDQRAGCGVRIEVRCLSHGWRPKGRNVFFWVEAEFTSES